MVRLRDQSHTLLLLLARDSAKIQMLKLQRQLVSILSQARSNVYNFVNECPLHDNV